MFQSATLGSSQEATGLVRENFQEAALALEYGPTVCSVWSAQATNAVKTPPHVPGLNSLYAPTGALQIESSEESDQGKYECVATNSAGTRYSAPANLYVRGKDSGSARPCLHKAELLLPGVLPRALGVDTRGAVMGLVSLSSRRFHSSHDSSSSSSRWAAS